MDIKGEDVIKIVGNYSKFIEGEGWVTEIPEKVLAEKIVEMAKETKPSTEGFTNDFWSLLILACIFSGGKK